MSKSQNILLMKVVDKEDNGSSRDVMTLFTNTPIDQTLSIVKDRLEKEDVHLYCMITSKNKVSS